MILTAECCFCHLSPDPAKELRHHPLVLDLHVVQLHEHSNYLWRTTRTQRVNDCANDDVSQGSV